MTDDKVMQLALDAGAAKFYPQGQLEWSERNYLVGLRFLQRFAEAIEREVRATAGMPGTLKENGNGSR